MKNIKVINNNWGLLTILSYLILFTSCNKEIIYANLTINEIEITEIFHSKSLDLPFSFSADNPNFDLNDPATWTGNMAQYIKHSYNYRIDYKLNHSGTEIAYETEIDLIYTTETGKEKIKTIKIGNVSPKSSNKRSHTIYNVGEQIVDCIGEIYWYD